ncbi:MAG: PEGA domain-containing protein, partial [bacterium]
MNKSELIYRRITYSLFIILFLIVTPLIIFYTQGYRFNFKNQHIQQTGILVISSNPKKADITLNDKYTEKNTPTRLENLMPGNYNIKLSKPGYYSWEKKLPIYENYTSFAENILLWKQTTSSPLTNIASSGQIAISPNKQDAYFIDNKGSLNFLDTASASYQAIASLGIGTIIESYDWNIGGYKTLLKTKNNKNQ